MCEKHYGLDLDFLNKTLRCVSPAGVGLLGKGSTIGLRWILSQMAVAFGPQPLDGPE